MNKILLATTALVATAGLASAEVALTGSAEMGLADKGDGSSVEFHHDLDVRFTLSGETDGGLTFGASIDLDENVGDIGAGSGSHAVFISGGFGTVTLGDTDGALDWAMTEVAIGSAIADDHSTHVGYNGNAGLDGAHDGQVLRYDNTFGDFGVAVSAELNDGDDVSSDDGSELDTTYGLGLRYNVALAGLDLGLGLGYQTGAIAFTVADGTGDFGDDDNIIKMNADLVGLSVDTTFANGLRAILNYSKGDLDNNAGDFDHTALGLGYTSGDLTISANYGEFGKDFDHKGYGVAVNYDLGGGAVVQFGYGKSDYGSDSQLEDSDGNALAGTDNATWSLGLAMSF